MNHFNLNRNQKIYEVISILKLISLLICGIIVFTLYPYSKYKSGLNNAYGSETIAINFIAIAIFILIYESWIHSIKKTKVVNNINVNGLIEFIVLFSIYTGLIFVSGYHESQYKFLYLFIIIANTIQYGTKIGVSTAILSSLIILSIDLHGVGSSSINTNFETDIVMSGLFIVVAWSLGYYVNLENEYRENAIQLANNDELTGVYNHRYFQNILSDYIENAHQTSKSISLLFIDIDHFKNYNDLYGHTAGDNVLRIIGDILKKNVREEDIVSRYGGEEFAIILPDVTEETAVQIGNRLRDAVENEKFQGEEYQPNGKLTVSIGVSSYPLKAKTKQELINTADDALYRAKFFNKNRVECYYSVLDELKTDMDEQHIDLISSIKTLISVINAKDRYTYAHTDRVVIYCELMGNHLGLSDNDKKLLRYGAYLHDIGKIQISKDILIKRGTLTDEEWNVMRTHPQCGVDIIRTVPALNEVCPLILHHHERYDGSGYPHSLKENEIPFLVRILSVSDSFDAMTSNRPYSNRKSYSEAIQELKENSGTQFDPELVNEFIKMLNINKDKLDFQIR
jgi:diguanylate cyclase (GGDEF)-like protein/putative nucleotidyltransferase with HDIG domain